LKGGDPMLFGRAQEEIDALAAAGIRYEVVPGVTAALAASAELGVSLTQRLVARTVVFATPRTAKDAKPSGWEKAVAAADTAALYMAAGDAEYVRDSLIAAGVAPSTPVAIAESVSLENSSLRAGTLAELPRLASASEGGPALLLIGEVFAACREPQAVQHENHEPAERPLGDRQAEEGPVHLGALAGALHERLKHAS